MNCKTLRPLAALIALLLAAVPLSGGAKAKCGNEPKECERQIRTLLSQKYGPLGFVVTNGPNGSGIVIKSINPASPAERAGLRAGDRIISMGRHDLSKASLAQLRKVRELLMAESEKEPEAQKVVIIVNRVGTFRRTTLRMEKISTEQIDKIVATHLREVHSEEGSN